MSNHRPTGKTLWLTLCLAFAASFTQAQTGGRTELEYEVSDPSQRLEMVINTSRILTTKHKIPQVLVENESILRAQPIAANQIQLSALRTGFTSLTVWDEKREQYTVDVLVYGDARELENLLMAEFPDASLRIRPLASSVVVSGYVPRPDMVSRIVEMAKDYYPNVINNMVVGGVQQVLLHVKVMEISRTKLRKFGFDWSVFMGDDGLIQNSGGTIANFTFPPGGGVSPTGGETVAIKVANSGNDFFGFLEALRQYNMVKILAEPTLVTTSGRPASFSSGGEFPILVPQALGTTSVEYREFGTRIDFVPIVLGNGRIRLEVRPQVSELDPTRSVSIDNTTVPGLRTRWADTAVEMNAGQTLALAGLIQNQVEAENKGLPFLADLPWLGAAFRRVEEKNNEIELLIMVTPEFVSALDPHEVPPCGPGQLTTSPDDHDLYWRGYIEVPKCCEDGNCAECAGGVGPASFDSRGTRDSIKILPSSGQLPASAKLRFPQHVRKPGPRGDGPPPPPRLIGPSGYDDLE